MSAVALPACKLCEWTASSNDVRVFGPEVHEHWRTEHPEVWAEYQQMMIDTLGDGTEGNRRQGKAPK